MRLQVIINRKVLIIPLDTAWLEALFDEEAGRCLDKQPKKFQGPGYKEVPARTEALMGGPLERHAADNNLLIWQARSRARGVCSW